MNRLARYRALQTSVPGLEQMYDMIGLQLQALTTSDSRVLIVGAGGGREIELISRLTERPWITALDPSPGHLAETRDRAEQLRLADSVRFHIGEVDDLPRVERFDVVLILMVLHCIRDMDRERALLAAVRRRLAPAAHVIMADMAFDADADLNAMLRAYRKAAHRRRTPADLVELEASAARENSERTRSRLQRVAGQSGYAVVRHVATAHWYWCVRLRPAASDMRTGRR